VYITGWPENESGNAGWSIKEIIGLLEKRE
jgi:hypothetical protein